MDKALVTESIKQTIIGEVLGGRDPREVARENGISQSAVYSWVRKYRISLAEKNVERNVEKNSDEDVERRATELYGDFGWKATADLVKERNSVEKNFVERNPLERNSVEIELEYLRKRVEELERQHIEDTKTIDHLRMTNSFILARIDFIEKK